jgi:type IV secretory pathway VirJ component
LIDIYADRWNVDHVILAGYSFGASVLPAAYRSIPAEAQAKVSEVALLGPGANADWQITVSGWLGSTSSRARPVAPDLSALPADRVLCIYGEKDPGSVCPALVGTGAKVLRTGGGHHFDGDYPALARHILDGH